MPWLVTALKWLITTKAGQWVSLAIIKPFLKKITKQIKSWWLKRQEIKRKKKERKKRVERDKKKFEDYEQADNSSDAHDTFDQLP